MSSLPRTDPQSPEQVRQPEPPSLASRLKDWVQGHRGTIALGTAVILIIGSMLSGIDLVGKARDFACNNVPGAGNRLDCSEARKSHEPVTAREIYETRLVRFRIAANTGDADYLRFLTKNAFRIQPDDICGVADSLVERKGGKRLPEAAVEIFASSVSRNSVCERFSYALRRAQSIPLVLTILEAGLFPGLKLSKDDEGREGGCGWTDALDYWPKTSQLIDALVARHGAPADFSTGLKTYINLFDKLEAAPRKSYVEACVHNGFNRMAFGSLELFHFSNTCLNVKRIVRVDQAMGERNIEQRIFDYCDKGIPQTDYAIDTRSYRSTLLRWLP